MDVITTADRKVRLVEGCLRELGWDFVGNSPAIARHPSLNMDNTRWGDDGVVNIRSNGALVVHAVSARQVSALKRAGCTVVGERSDCILIHLPDTIGP